MSHWNYHTHWHAVWDSITLYKWCTVASGTFTYVVPRLTRHHEGAARVMTFQPRDNIFECSTSKHASSVLLYDQLRASTKSRWIIYLRLCFTPKKPLKFPMCNCVVWLLHHHHISTYCWWPFLGFRFHQFSFPFLILIQVLSYGLSWVLFSLFLDI